LTGPIVKTDYTTDEEITSEETATTYNNFYELGTDKSDPARHADKLRTDPWSVTVDGECAKPGKYTLEDISYLSISLCRSLVNGYTVERVCAGRFA